MNVPSASSTLQLSWRISATRGNSWNARRSRMNHSRFSDVKRNDHGNCMSKAPSRFGAMERPEPFLEARHLIAVEDPVMCETPVRAWR